MVRPVYNQSPGNPVQVHLLPQKPLELEFAYRDTNEIEENLITRKVLVELVWVSFVGLLACWIPPMTSEWPNLAFALFCLILVNVWRDHAARKIAIRMLHLPLIIAACLYHLLDLPLPPEICAVLIANVWLSREIVRHFTFVTTVAPLSIAESWDKREAIDKWTTVSVLPILLVSLALVTTGRTEQLLFAAAGAWAIIFAFHNTSPSRYWQGFQDAIRSWFCYNRRNLTVPGTLYSPAGNSQRRLNLCVVVVLINSLLVGRYTSQWLDRELVLETGRLFISAGPMDLVAHAATLVLNLVAWSAFPLMVLLGSVFVTGAPAFGDVAVTSNSRVSSDQWKEITRRIRQSKNQEEAESLYLGRIAFDQSPLLVPKSVFAEHAHFLGDSGSGKTARGLSPLVEQILSRGDSSVMILDLKGDSDELFQALREGARAAKEIANENIPVKYLSTSDNEWTFSFNPLATPMWPKFNTIQKTDILCGALGLNYGSDYGEGYYSSANSAVLLAVMQNHTDVQSFEQLADALETLVKRPQLYGLDEKSRDAGNHLRMLVVRLAQLKQLNACRGNSPNDVVVEHTIDPAALFRSPQAHYYKLSAALGPGASPEIARLAAFMLMSASAVSERNVRVYLVIDEFQRMATRNLDYLLQLARSMGVSVVLANQSIQDLRRYDLVNVLETNCRYKQWFAISSWEDQQRLVQASGETVDELESRSSTQSAGPKGSSIGESFSRREMIAPRLTQNDVKLASDEDRKSIVLINRGAGYAQFGGLPFIVETDYHISKQEYEARKKTSWPAGETGAFVPAEWEKPQAPRIRRGRQSTPQVVTEETIDFDISSHAGATDKSQRAVPKGASRPNRKRRLPKEPERATDESSTHSEVADALSKFLKARPASNELEERE